MLTIANSNMSESSSSSSDVSRWKSVSQIWKGLRTPINEDVQGLHADGPIPKRKLLQQCSGIPLLRLTSQPFQRLLLSRSRTRKVKAREPEQREKQQAEAKVKSKMYSSQYFFRRDQSATCRPKPHPTPGTGPEAQVFCYNFQQHHLCKDTPCLREHACAGCGSVARAYNDCLCLARAT